MPASHGSKARVFVDEFNLTSYFSSTGAEASRDLAEVSAFGDSSKKYIVGLRDASLSAEGFFDGAANAVDEVLTNVLSADSVLVTVLRDTDAVGKFGESMEAVQTAYAVTSTVDDASRVSMEAQSRTGVERVVSLHPMQSEAATANGTAVDNAASSALGTVGYCHVIAITAGSVALKIQHSVDNSVWVDLITFQTVTPANLATLGAQRVKVATNPVNRYLRAVWTITTGPATFHVNCGRQPLA